MHHASSRRESHRAAGAQGHLIDDGADDADRCLVGHGSGRNCGLLLKRDNASLDGPGDSDNALGTERFRKGDDAIRGSYEHPFGVVGELPHSGHDLAQVGRMVECSNHSCQLEGQRWERLPHRPRRGGHNRRLRSDPCRLDWRERFDELTPDDVGVGLALLHPVAGYDELALQVRGIKAARCLRIGDHHVAGRRWEHILRQRRGGGHLGFLRSETWCLGLIERVEEQTPHVEGGRIALYRSLATLDEWTLHLSGVNPARRLCTGSRHVAGCRWEHILRRRRRSSSPSRLPSDARCLGLICRFEQLAPEPAGVGLAYLHPLVTCCDDGVVHPRSVNAARRFRIRPLARRLNADPGFVDGSGHRFSG
jgi:hypothetical protein